MILLVGLVLTDPTEPSDRVRTTEGRVTLGYLVVGLDGVDGNVVRSFPLPNNQSRKLDFDLVEED